MTATEALIWFWQRFWIGVLAVIAVGALILGLTLAGFLFQNKVAAPLSKTLQSQRANNDYQVTQQSQAYQDTYLSQTEKDYAQIAADKYTLERDKAAGNPESSDVVQGDYGVITADITRFCGDGGKLTQMTRVQLPPDTARFYDANC